MSSPYSLVVQFKSDSRLHIYYFEYSECKESFDKVYNALRNELDFVTVISRSLFDGMDNSTPSVLRVKDVSAVWIAEVLQDPSKAK